MTVGPDDASSTPEVHDQTDRADQPDRAEQTDRADLLAKRLAVPVLVAALASVPAVFLTLLDDPYQSAGAVLNTVSGAVLIAETVVLFAVSENRTRWVRRNWWLVVLTVVMVPAVLFALGPVQLLRLTRLVRVFGALRIIRVTRIVKAGRIVRQRAGLDGVWQRVISGVLIALVALFVAIVLADPTSESRLLLDGAVQRLGILGVLLAGTVLGIATYIVRTYRADDDKESPSRPGSKTGDGSGDGRPGGAADGRAGGATNTSH